MPAIPTSPSCLLGHDAVAALTSGFSVHNSGAVRLPLRCRQAYCCTCPTCQGCHMSDCTGWAAGFQDKALNPRPYSLDPEP